MKKGVTPSNYKDLVQKKLVADIFKTPDQRLQDESKGEVQFNTKTRKPFEGAEDETVQLTSLDSQKPVRTSTLYFTKNAWDTTEDSTIILQAVYR
jgi:hypothetical protein